MGRSPELDRAGAARGTVAALVGLAGLAVPGAALDGPTFLAWLACVAAPVGTWLGARGARVWPTAFVVPAAWGLASIWLGLDVERAVARPLGSLAVVGGLHLGGHGLGRLLGERRPSWAWAALAVGLCAGAPLAFGLGAAGEAPRATPRLARWALEASPVGWTLECGGWDWAHADRDLYERSGVEFAPRHPHRVRSTGAAVLACGALLAAAGALARGRDGEPAAEA